MALRRIADADPPQAARDGTPAETALAGWGDRIRTWEWRNQNPQEAFDMQRLSGLMLLNLRRLGRHSIDFAALRLDADRTRHSSGHGRSEILQKVDAGTRILDQDRGRAMLRSETDDLAAQLRIFEPTPVDMEEVRVILVGEPRGASRIVD